jgi:hypothetical protein
MFSEFWLASAVETVTSPWRKRDKIKIITHTDRKS